MCVDGGETCGHSNFKERTCPRRGQLFLRTGIGPNKLKGFEQNFAGRW